MTPAEKNKLYTAIGYSETAVNPNLPKNVSSMAKKTIGIGKVLLPQLERFYCQVSFHVQGSSQGAFIVERL